MFTKVHLKNFRSLDDFELDFSSKQLAIIYGENGAGKSNLMSAFVLLNELLQTMDVRDAYEELINQESLFNDEKMEKLLKQRLLSGLRDIQAIINDYRMIGTDTPVVAEYAFCIGSNNGKYRVELGKDEIVYERLEYMLNQRRGVHFECTTDGITINKAIVKDKALYQDIKMAAKKYWGKHSLLAIIQHEIDDKSNSYGRSNLSDTFSDVLAEFSLLSCSVRIGHRQWNEIFAPFEVFDNPDRGRIEKTEESQLDIAEKVFSSFFCSINSDIQQVYYKRDFSDNWINYSLFFKKIVAGKERSIPFSKESTGNHQLLDILCYLLTACVGGTVVLDEADSGIHDLLFKKIMQEINGNISGQIIMTTHNTTLMETEFAKDATYILSEDESGKTVVRAITDYEKRTFISNNIRSKYLNNQYEGLPKVTKIEFEPLIELISSQFE